MEFALIVSLIVFFVFFLMNIWFCAMFCKWCIFLWTLASYAFDKKSLYSYQYEVFASVCCVPQLNPNLTRQILVFNPGSVLTVLFLYSLYFNRCLWSYVWARHSPQEPPSFWGKPKGLLGERNAESSKQQREIWKLSTGADLTGSRKALLLGVGGDGAFHHWGCIPNDWKGRSWGWL